MKRIVTQTNTNQSFLITFLIIFFYGLGINLHYYRILNLITFLFFFSILREKDIFDNSFYFFFCLYTSALMHFISLSNAPNNIKSPHHLVHKIKIIRGIIYHLRKSRIIHKNTTIKACNLAA